MLCIDETSEWAVLLQPIGSVVKRPDAEHRLPLLSSESRLVAGVVQDDDGRRPHRMGLNQSAGVAKSTLSGASCLLGAGPAEDRWRAVRDMGGPGREGPECQSAGDGRVGINSSSSVARSSSSSSPASKQHRQSTRTTQHPILFTSSPPITLLFSTL